MIYYWYDLKRLSTGDNFADDKEEDVESLLKR